jgi:hypothetical protein
MKSKSEKVMEQPGSARPVGTVLRLVQRDEREQHETEPGTAKKTATDRKIQRPPCGGDDDDSGPTAA